MASDDKAPITTYFDDIRDKPLLNQSEEIELSKRIFAGDEEARQKLIQANLKLVVRIAKPYRNPSIPFGDIIQEGNIGLIQAASKFDYRKAVRFSTYSAWWIHQAIARYVNANRRFVRLPQRKEMVIRRAQKAKIELTERLKRQPSVDEIADVIYERPDKLAHILNSTIDVCSLNSSRDGYQNELIDSCGDCTYSPEKEFMLENAREEAHRLLSTLMSMERNVLMQRFSFHGGPKRTLRSIATQYGVSPETIRQTEKRALKKLREKAADLGNILPL